MASVATLGISFLGTSPPSRTEDNARSSQDIRAAFASPRGTWSKLGKVKLAAFDLDGTLLDEHGKLTNFTRSTLHTIFGSSQGSPVMVIATGRGLVSVPYKDMPAPVVYILSSNGGQVSVWHPPRGSEPGRLEELSASRLSVRETRAILALAGPADCDAVWGTDSGLLYEAVAHTPAGHTATTQIMGPDEMKFVTALESSLQRGALAIIVMASDPDAFAERVRAALPADMLTGPGAVAIISYAPKPMVAFHAAGVDKGMALQRLCEKLRISLDEAIAFGDGINDVEILEVAGCGVAPSNAEDKAKRAADVVLTVSNGEDAVAKALLELQRLGHFRGE